ncbi:serpentine type 7TM GPCR chemoreceptor str domain-containing protein [Ditylenchus destructor]|uniref:Serpentine type 7TM GPCR chemoreceptor str domain-containing protein n=1 Tax=Ditylenchus destructor TaxID=166010 RepID=A0AAD4MT32_9BILA|nr:serpentine type 7TM GPCR chemoreceptor str domain-containing protein [Ditylenchus destructor]
MVIHKFAQVIGTICFAIGMILNSLLVFLICKNRSTVCDKSYQPIILQICVMDMLTLIIYTFYMPAFIGDRNDGIYYTLGFFNDVFDNAPLFTQFIYKAWFFFAFLFTISPSVQFLYRYLVLCRDWKPSYRLYMGFYSLIVLVLLSFDILFNEGTIYVSRTSNAPYREHIFTDNPTNADLVVFRISSSPWTAIVAINIVAIPFIVVIICGIRIWLHFRRHFRLVSHLNESNQRLQTQINYTLFIQGGMPIFGHLATLLLTLYLKFESEYMTFLPNFITLVIIDVNPLLTILVIDSYRRAVLNLCLCRPVTLPKQVNVLTTVMQSP